ncbi:MAG: hypothetical protein L6R30_25035 [Thermoanaerobaculia bacterium]|nr:hypothetical protein [Thermoanaerobaculia bacterium]
MVDNSTLRQGAAMALGHAFHTMIDPFKHVDIPVDGRGRHYLANLKANHTTRSYDLLPVHGWVLGMSRIYAGQFAAGNYANRSKAGTAACPDLLILGEIVTYEKGYLFLSSKIVDIETGVIKHMSTVTGMCPDWSHFLELLYQGLAQLHVRFGKTRSW